MRAGKARSSDFIVKLFSGPYLPAISVSSLLQKEHPWPQRPPPSGTIEQALENSRAACAPGIDPLATRAAEVASLMHASAAARPRTPGDRCFTSRHLHVEGVDSTADVVGELVVI